MKRVLCLYIPFLSSDRLRNAHSCALSERRGSPSLTVGVRNKAEYAPVLGRTHGARPIATITPRAAVLRIVHVNRAAYDLRVRPGLTLADAKAMVPELVTYDDDPIVDRRQLETLAVWADCLSPIVHIEGEDALFVDVTGCERLFEGEENLLRRAIDGLIALGFTARGAVADTPGGAWALAHDHHRPAFISDPGRLVADLAPLPVRSLRIDARTTAALASVGVETVASLLHLPRSSLASRFGDELLNRIDQALGDLTEVLTPYRPKPVLTRRCHFGAATTRTDVLQEAIQRTLERFCESLAKRVAGVRQLFVTFYCDEVVTEQGTQKRTVTLPVNLSQPTRSASHLHSLLIVLLDRLHLPAPADSLMVWAREIDRLDDWQDELFTTDSNRTRELGDLLDRLAVRLGLQSVVKPVSLSEHQPERAFRYAPLVGRERAVSCQSSVISCQLSVVSNQRAADFSGAPEPGPRPLRLSARPLEIAATAVVPDGPPIAFRVNGMQHTVADSVGPERIETGWWRGPHIKRDYYRITTDDGLRFWLFRNRDTDRWFLHGWFD